MRERKRAPVKRWSGRTYVGRYVMFDTVIAVWADTLKNALHEVLETAFVLTHSSYTPFDSLISRDTGRFHFHCDHATFTRLVDHAGDMMAYLGPDLLAVWKRRRP